MCVGHAERFQTTSLKTEVGGWKSFWADIGAVSFAAVLQGHRIPAQEGVNYSIMTLFWATLSFAG